MLEKQNPDGGWPYSNGVSWTEPTAYAVMASYAAGERRAAERGAAWMLRTQRSDGGFPPQFGVAESTWVTTLALLLPEDLIAGKARRRAVEWLLRLTGKETTPVYRLRQFLLGNERPPDQEHHGWPWFPGTAAWVGPTSMALLALRNASRQNPSSRIEERIDAGRRFLLSRMCHGGGWNHGGIRALGREGRPYPETTGMALLALAGASSRHLSVALNAAEATLDQCRSADGLNWLRLGLLSHGRLAAGYCPPPLPYRTVRDRALALLVEQAQSGRSPFLQT